MLANRSPASEWSSGKSIPARAGIGLRAPHCEQVIAERPPISWLEVHSENFFADGGPQIDILTQIRELYPISLHGVGLSLGSSDPLDREHLASLRQAVNRFEPGLVSEHVCWGAVDGVHFNDLLPLPYTGEALLHLASRIQQVQDALGRRILVENVSSYLAYRCSEMTEWEFLAELAARAGCGILLDLNNVYVNSRNLEFDPFEYIAAIPADLIEEIHLAGHTVNRVGAREILIDTHSAQVADVVWRMYTMLCGWLGSVPTLIEWDADIPVLEVLLAEARRADNLRASAHALAA